MAAAAVLLAAWLVSAGPPSQPVRPARAAQVNSYSTFGTVSYSAGSCGVDETAGIVSAPGIKKILKVSNTEIYAVGCFTNFAGVAEADYVARWNGTTWSGLGSSGDLNAIVHDAVVYKSTLHIAGEFTDAGGDVTADMVAKWNGSAWVGLAVAGATSNPNGVGSPKDSAGNTDYATSLHVQENGAGTADDVLLVGGRFYNGINDGRSGFQIPNTRNIATWNGSVWGSVGSTNPYPGSFQTDMVVRDIATVGSDVYLGAYRSEFSSSKKTYLFMRYTSSTNTWDRPGATVSQSVFGTGFGIFTMEVIGSNILVGGTFSGLSGVAENLALFSTAAGTFTDYNGFAASFGTGAVVRAISDGGGQIFVGGSFPGVTGTSGGVARWTGSSWQGIGRNAPAIVNALVADNLYNSTDSRVLIGSSTLDIGGVASADGLAALAVTSGSTLDSMTVSSGSLSPSFNPSVTAYTLSLPNASATVDFTVLARESGSAIKRTNSTGTLALGSDTDTLSVSVGATEDISFVVNPVSGAGSTTYSVAVTRAAAATTTAAPTTAAPTTAAPKQGSVAPQSTAPLATEAPGTMAVPATSLAATPATRGATVAAAPVVSTKRAATGSSIAKYASLTVASGSRISLKVASSSARYCKVKGTSLIGVKAGSCIVTVTVTPKKGKAVSGTVALKVT